MSTRVTIRDLFIKSFSLIIVIKAMEGITLFDNIPSYISYMFTMAWLLFIFVKGYISINIVNKKANIIIAVLFMYFLLWGTIFAAPGMDSTDISHELFRKIMMMFFVIVGVTMISKFECLDEVMHTTYKYMALYMLLLLVLNINNINIFRTISLFWNSYAADRYRTLFGYSSSNVVAEAAMTVILLSLLRIKKELTAKKIVLYAINCAMMLIIIAANSRGTFVAACLMMVIYLIIYLNKKKSVKKLVRTWFPIALVFIFIIIALYVSKGGSFEQFLLTINRNHLLADLQIVQLADRSLLGLGNLSGGFFSKNSVIYGMTTDYLELFYAGVYVRSGLVGLLIIISLIVYILKSIIAASKISQDKLSKWIIIIYVYMLFISLFEQYLFSNGYASSQLFLIGILSFISISEKKVRKINTAESINMKT